MFNRLIGLCFQRLYAAATAALPTDEEGSCIPVGGGAFRDAKTTSFHKDAAMLEDALDDRPIFRFTAMNAYNCAGCPNIIRMGQDVVAVGVALEPGDGGKRVTYHEGCFSAA